MGLLARAELLLEGANIRGHCCGASTDLYLILKLTNPFFCGKAPFSAIATTASHTKVFNAILSTIGVIYDEAVLAPRLAIYDGPPAILTD